MGVLANRDFVKMNGLGNEIVIVDLRQSVNGARRSVPTRRARQHGRSRTTSSWRSTPREATRRPGPHLQQRRVGGRRLRQRHALRRLAGQCETGKAASEFRDVGRCNRLLARRAKDCSRSTWACRAFAGTRFRWQSRCRTRARSTCNSDRPARRSCARRRPSTWATRTRSSGSTMSMRLRSGARSGRWLEHHRSFHDGPTLRSPRCLRAIVS